MNELIATDVQRLEQDVIVELFEIDVSEHGNGILRFTTTSDAGASLFYNGFEYVPAPVEASGFEWSGSGTLPRPKLKLATGDTAFVSILMGTDDLTGCAVKRIRTYRKYLDDGILPNPTARFPEENFVVNKKSGQTRKLLEFELATRMDQEGRKVPALSVIRDSCLHRFRRWNGAQWVYDEATCPYAGEEMYTVDGLVTSDPTEARCGKRISDCERHFGENAVLPMRAFPGVSRIQ